MLAHTILVIAYYYVRTRRGEGATAIAVIHQYLQEQAQAVGSVDAGTHG